MTNSVEFCGKAGRTSVAKARKVLNPDELFFFLNSGYGYNPKTETAQAGRLRGARALAKAEQTARNMGWSFRWEDDWEVNHVEQFGYEPSNCEVCGLWDGDNLLQSLGCIDDATTEYRRVVQAELALEAEGELEDEI